jgi:hypothetical protein
MECEQKKIKFNCTYSCPLHQKCCDCIEYHRRRNEFPACFFSEKMERTYDRSLSALLKDKQNNN